MPAYSSVPTHHFISQILLIHLSPNIVYINRNISKVYQYHGLNALQTKHGAEGYSTLAVPCNQFHFEEPAWSGVELMDGLKYVRPGDGFIPKFPLTQKIDVNGIHEHPMYTFLKSQCPPATRVVVQPVLYSPIYTEDVRWNYEKFLVGPDGKALYRYDASVDPATDVELNADIRSELAKLKANVAASPLVG
ncbi:Glutathione peroxidase 3 [Mactra antiquata]